MAMRLLLPILLLSFGCANIKPKRMVVPPEMQRQLYTGAPARPAAQPLVAGKPGAAAQPALAPAKPLAPSADPSQRYLLRLAENGRIWEVELPETTGAYELRIPLEDTKGTQADEKLLAGGAWSSANPAKKSYLAGLAHVRELYDLRKYELAFIDLNDLEQTYPNDARLLAMKGTLYLKLGRTKLARDTWQHAVQLDPNDTQTAEALRGLKEE
jgi:tetratricopeptide (TPR) repeat protein